MKFRKFVIEDYRAVERAELPVGNNLVPIVGVNESGKTSILEAILAFDKNSDRVNRGRHLFFKNRYEHGEQQCNIVAEVIIDAAEDIDLLSESLGLTLKSPVLAVLQGAYDNQTPLRIVRNLNKKQYSVEGIELPKKLNKKVADHLYKLLPFILYFDDFTDRVPEKIVLSRSEGGAGYSIKRSKDAEWQMILEEIFRRTTRERHSLDDFLRIKDSADQDNLLSDIRDALDREVMNDWRELKRYGIDLVENPEELRLQLKFTDLASGDFCFEFRVEDRARGGSRVFNVTERSKGFQWFFNFHMKLKYNPKYTDKETGAIYLLDEPGSYLHASAQRGLLQALAEISNTNTIVYCTHSQHFLDPDVIDIGRIKIAARKEGRVLILPFGAAGVVNYQGALTPLIDALQLKTGIFNRNIRRALICEGITDFYFFDMLLRFSAEFKSQRIKAIPGAGAQQLKELISFAIAWADDYRVMLDSDEEGRKAKGKYDLFFGAQEASRILLYATPARQDEVRLEDFLSEDDKRRLAETTSITDAKSAIAALYHGNKQKRKEFIQGLNEITRENLSVMEGHLRSLGG